MTDRIAGITLLALAAALAVLPALTWFAAPPDADPTRASGLAVAGQLWPVPLLAALIALAGAGIVAGRPKRGRRAARWAGPLALASSALALGLTLWAGADPGVALTIRLDDATETVPAPVRLEPAAVIAPIVAGVGVAIGAAATWIGWRA